MRLLHFISFNRHFGNCVVLWVTVVYSGQDPANFHYVVPVKNMMKY